MNALRRFSSRCWLCWLAVICLLPARVAMAQSSAPANAGWQTITPQNLASLADLPQSPGTHAVSLEITQAQLEAQPQALGVLRQWTREGGIIFLHTDAARSFGYETVPARERTNQVAGQLFGRAKAALPFGAHPLLWGEPSKSLDGQTSGAMGVQLVFYQMAPGDHLVISHPAGVPLLQVEDLAQPSDAPQYAAAIAPYGKGWAIFTPRFIEQNRADSGVFAQNLLRFVAERDQWTSVPGAAVQAAYEEAKQGGAQFSALAQALRAGATVTDKAEPRLLLKRNEASTLAATLDTAGQDEGAAEQAAASVMQLETRRVLQTTVDLAPLSPLRPVATLALPSAAAQLGLSAQQRQWMGKVLGARAALWNGVFAVAWAQTFGQPAGAQAAALAEAQKWWGQAESDDGSMPAALLASWRQGVAQALEVTQNEPPLALSWRDEDGRESLIRMTPVEAAINEPPPGPGLEYPSSHSFYWRYLQHLQGLMIAASEQGLGWRVEAAEVDLITAKFKAWSPSPAGIISELLPGERERYLKGGQIVVKTDFFADNTSGVATAFYNRDINNRWTGLELRLMMATRTLESILNDPDYRLLAGERLTEEVKLKKQQERRDQYYTGLLSGWSSIEGEGLKLTGTVAQLQMLNAIDECTQGGTTPPAWLKDGLTGRGLSALAAVMQNNNPYPPLPPDLQHDHLDPRRPELSHASWSARVIDQTQAAAADFATAPVDYFYERFGAGCVVETLQRLGSGQSMDQALLATTGMTEKQFLADAQAAREKHD
jgi:hypothetical protein